ncbi:YtxH domain-containing protein [Flavobacterium sp. LS2R12]|uniref:YtxH domain-containing protein n=1 Tax=unclassified Flavobacterium TaxID=196869 RepID=UPI003AAE18FE
MKNNTLAIGLLGGLAIGTALGILFAPAKGSETRKKIADKSTDLKDIVADSSGKLTNKITQTINELKRESQNLIENTTESVKDEIQNFDHLRDINKAIV